MTATESGYAYQLRYAVWRAVWIAAGRDPLSGTARTIHIEYPLRDRVRRTQSVDVVIEDADGNPLELIETKEHDSFLPPESLKSFLARAEAMRTVVPPMTRFRFVSSQKLTKGLDLARPDHLETALASMGIAKLNRPDVAWELGAGSQVSLLDRTLVLLTSDGGDALDLYCRLFARAHAQLARRRPKQSDTLRRVEEELMGELFFTGARRRLPRVSGEAGLDIEEIRETMARLSRVRPPVHELARKKVAHALRRHVFQDEKITIEQIFVEPTAFELSMQRRQSGSAPAATPLLMRWYTELREGRESRLPLLLIGTFGLGKSTLLTMFAHKLFELSEWVTPVLIPLRDLAGLADEGFRPVLERYVREEYRIDLSEAPAVDSLRYLLLCDGFDELNLYYSRVDAAEWAEKAFDALAALARRPDIGVVISSRPLVSLERRESQPQIELGYFSPAQIEQWCANYRRARPLVDASFNYETLRKRGLADVAETPIVLYMIALLFEANYLTQPQYTRTEVFRTFIDWTESGGYAQQRGKGERKHRLPENYREILQEIAWLLFLSPRGHLPEDELIAALQKTFGKVTRDAIRVGSNLLVAHMLQPARGAKGKARLIEFTHQSFREYLVAERIWRMLEPVRQGKAEGKDVWASIGGGFFTQAEVDFLADMIRATPLDDALWLYEELDWGVHLAAYFQEPLASTLPKDDDETVQENIAGRVVLAFLLRLKLYRHLEGSKHDPMPPSDLDFRQILDFLSAFEQDAMRELLLKNLSGLRFGAEAELTNIELADAEMQDVRLVSANFKRAILVGCNIERSEFRKCDFAHASLSAQYLFRTKFIRCDFTAAEIHIENELELGTTKHCEFSGCNFTDAVFTGLVVGQYRFAGNDWTRTRIEAGDEVILERCTLDASAERFFRRAGATLIDCKTL